MTNLSEDLRDIASAFKSLLEGLAYIDDSVAEKIAKEFSDKLSKATREVFSEMSVKIASELAKPPKKKKRRQQQEDRMSLFPSQSYEDEPIGYIDETSETTGRSRPVAGYEDMGDFLASRETTQYPRIPNQGGRTIQRRIPQEELEDRG